MTSALLLPVIPLAACMGVIYVYTYLLPRMRHHGSAARVQARQSESPLAHEVPYWVIDDEGGILSITGDLAAGVEIDGVDIDCMSTDALQALNGQLHSLLQTLPAGVRLQYIYVSDADQERMLAKYEAAPAMPTPISRRLRDNKVASIRGNKQLRHARLYLFATLPQEQSRVGARLGMRARAFPVIDTVEHDKKLRKLRELVGSLRSSLQSAHITTRRLAGDEIKTLAFEFLNPARHAAQSDLRQRRKRPPANARRDGQPSRGPTVAVDLYQTAREQLCLSNAKELKDEIIIDGQRHRVLTLRTLPSFTTAALLEQLTVGIPFPCRVQLAIELLDEQASMDALKKTRNMANALAQQSAQRRNQEAEAQAADVEQLIDKNLADSIRMVDVSLSIVLAVDEKAPNADEVLDERTNQILHLLAAMDGAQGMIETWAQLDAFLATLPANAGHHTRSHTCTSENAAHMMLVFASWRGTTEPALVLANGRNFLVGIDPFSPHLDNPNSFVAGVAGSGKSVFTNYLLMHLFSTGCKGLLVDVGGSYRKMMELFGGDYVAFDSHPALNLFPHPERFAAAGDSEGPMTLAFVLTVLESLLIEHDRPQLRRVEKHILSCAVKDLYRGRTTAPILSDLRDHLQSLEFEAPGHTVIARDFADRLEYWTSGPHAELLNRPSTVELTSDFAAFDLKGVPEDVRTPVLLILSSMIWNLVTRDREERKVVVFDEVWSLLADPASARLIAELYRTSRKYRCSMMAISQSVDDFVGSSIASALVNNSATTYLLRHRIGHEQTAETFHLNERETWVFRGLEMRRGEYSELLVLHGEHHFLGRVVLTPFEYWCTTTAPADQAAMRRLKDRHDPTLPLDQLLDHCARQWPCGAQA